MPGAGFRLHRSPSPDPARGIPVRAQAGDGGVVEYAVPNAASPGTGCAGCGKASLRGITARRDGNVWYFDVGQSTVGRVTPAGVITQFAVPGTGSGSQAITAAPDGNVWFKEFWTGRVGRMTPAGMIATFQAPIGSLRGIVTGPDHNLWFVEADNQRCARLRSGRHTCGHLRVDMSRGG